MTNIIIIIIIQNIQKISLQDYQRNYGHTAHLAHLIWQSERHQRSLVVTLLDLRNAFGEVHHRLLPVVLRFHHVPDSVVRLIDSNLYQDFRMTVVTDSYSTRTLHVEKGVLLYIWLISWLHGEVHECIVSVLTRVASAGESRNLEGISQLDIFILLKNKRNRTNHDINN